MTALYRRVSHPKIPEPIPMLGAPASTAPPEKRNGGVTAT